MLSLFLYTAPSDDLFACVEASGHAHHRLNRANDINGAVLDGLRAIRFAKGFYIAARRNRAGER